VFEAVWGDVEDVDVRGQGDVEREGRCCVDKHQRMRAIESNIKGITKETMFLKSLQIT